MNLLNKKVEQGIVVGNSLAAFIGKRFYDSSKFNRKDRCSDVVDFAGVAIVINYLYSG